MITTPTTPTKLPGMFNTIEPAEKLAGISSVFSANGAPVMYRRIYRFPSEVLILILIRSPVSVISRSRKTRPAQGDIHLLGKNETVVRKLLPQTQKPPRLERSLISSHYLTSVALQVRRGQC